MNAKLRFAAILAGLILVLAGVELWSGVIRTSVSAIGSPLQEIPFGRDLRAYTGAGELAFHRMGPEIYDSTSTVYVTSGAARFVYPPWFAILMIPLAAIPFQILFPVWTLVGIGLLLWVLAVMDVQPAMAVAVAALLSVAGIAQLYLGQTSFVITATLLLAMLALRSGKWAAAGAAIALLAFKPYLLVGIAVWWLIDIKQKWREVLAVLVTSGLLIVGSALWLPGSWSAFVSSLSDFGELVNPGFEATILSSLRTLLLGSTSAIFVFYTLLTAGLLWGFMITVLRHREADRVIASLAISVALLITPHGLPYDWLLLLVAGGLLLGELHIDRATIGAWGLLLGAALVFDNNLFTWQMTHFGFAIRIAAWVLLGITVFVVLRLRGGRTSPLNASRYRAPA